MYSINKVFLNRSIRSMSIYRIVSYRIGTRNKVKNITCVVETTVMCTKMLLVTCKLATTTEMASQQTTDWFLNTAERIRRVVLCRRLWDDWARHTEQHE